MRFDRIDLHTPRDPAQHRRAFVMGKIVPGLRAHISQHFCQSPIRLPPSRVSFETVSPPGASSTFASGSSASGISGGNFIRFSFWTNSNSFGANFATGSTQSTIPVLDRRARHAIVFRFVRSCAIVRPPCARTCFNPITPSESAPDMITQTAR